MSDRKLRESERRSTEGRTEAVRLLVERLRAGQVTEEQVAIAAWAGDAVAQLALGREPATGVDLVELAWRRLEQWFGEHAPKLLANLAPGATDEELAKIERVIGVSIPAELAASWRRHNGQRRPYSPACFREYWNLLSTRGTQQCWKMFQDLFDDDSGEDSYIAGSDHPREVRAAVWRARWVPIMTFDSDTICVDLDPTEQGSLGQVIERTNSCTYSVFAPGVSAALAQFAHDLDTGKFLTDGVNLFSNDEAGREQMTFFAEQDAKRRTRKKSATRKKVATKKKTRKAAPRRKP